MTSSTDATGLDAATVDIGRASELVFDYVADFTNDPEWRSEVVSITRTSGEVTDLGATYEQELQLAGRRLQTSFRVTEHRPPQLVSFEGGAGPVRVFGSILLSALGNDTTRVHFEHRMTGPWWFRVVEPVLARRRRAGIARDLDELRRILEADATDPT